MHARGRSEAVASRPGERVEMRRWRLARGAQWEGRDEDDRQRSGKSGGSAARVVLQSPVVQPRVLGDRRHPAGGDRRRRDRAGDGRPRPQHRAGVALRGPAPAGAGPRRLLLHRAQLPPRLAVATQGGGADGGGRGGVAGAGRGGEHGVHERGRERPRRHPRRADRVRGQRRGRRLAPAGRHGGGLHGRRAEVPGPARRDGGRRALHPPHVPHLGAGRAHRQGHRRPARPPRGRGQGPHPLRLVELPPLPEG
ncbi:MAG: hypothetical protein BWY94_01527 [Actinobacteria bacterium ADurb.BinA094]|nr:MAG: hypothetical protein BWY94_01527 [Actinobacteria bacterium ADurb.BinA094]